MITQIDRERGPSIGSIIKIIILVIVIGLAVNTLIAFLMDKNTVLKSLQRVRVVYLIIPFGCYLLINFIDSFRTMMIARQFSARVPFVQAFFNSVIGILFNNLTPMAAGGQPFQIYHLQQQGLNTRIATNIILSRFVENAMVLMVILLASTPLIIQLSQSLAIGGVLMYLGLIVTFIFAIFFLIALIKPHLIGRIAMLLSRSKIRKLLTRITKKDDWADRMVNWSTQLREEVHFLWTEKFSVMAFDTFLGIVDLLLQVGSLYYVIVVVVGMEPNVFKVLAAYVVVWQVVFYIPTPGASGSIEGAFAMVYSELTHNPALTLISIVIWRFATYYLHIFFGTVVLSIYLRARRNTPAVITE
jgi:hypothetical protein